MSVGSRGLAESRLVGAFVRDGFKSRSETYVDLSPSPSYEILIEVSSPNPGSRFLCGFITGERAIAPPTHALPSFFFKQPGRGESGGHRCMTLRCSGMQDAVLVWVIGDRRR